MGKALDLTGQKFGRLTAIRKTDKRKNKSIVWECLCDCGKICQIDAGSLKAGRTKSCGCLKKESDKKTKNTWTDLTGQKFGHLTAIQRVESDKYGHARWKCKCDCEAQTELIVFADNLKRGHTQSCGCERRSHGELAIAKILMENKIPFIQEYKAFKFSSGNYAKFDFYIQNKYFI